MSSSISVITTFPPNKWEQYAKNMLETFVEQWPSTINLKVYFEGTIPSDAPQSNRIEWIDLLALNPDLVTFRDKHKDNPFANGHKVGTNVTKKGSFLWEAVRFSHKSFCVSHATLNSSTDLIIWLDADVVTHSAVPTEFVESLLPKDFFTAYLGRQKIYPECGFVIYNTKHPKLKTFMDDWQKLYNDDLLFELDEYHDSFLFWHLLNKHDLVKDSFNISEGHPHRPGVHVFINSPLGKYMDHLKGSRKKQGRSKATDIYIKHDNEYWKNLK
jgi:hypothetical protein